MHVCVCQLLSACTGEERERERDKGRTVGAYALLVYKSSITSGCGLSAHLTSFHNAAPTGMLAAYVYVCVCVEYDMKLMFVQLAGPRRECTHSCAINLIYVSLSSRGSLRF